VEQKNLLSCDRRISVIMPTYNGASRGFLAEAIESVLAQTYQNIELCIVDDGSSDETKRLCFDYMTKQRMILYNRSDSALSIKYIYQDNAGVSVARNNGIRNTNGAFVCFLDDDDVWDAKKLEKQLAHIDEVADPCLGLSYTALEIKIIDAKSNRTGVVQAHRAHGNVFNRLLCQNLVDCTSSVLIPRPIFDDVGMFSPDLSYAEDYDLWLRIAKKYHIYSVEEPSTGGFVSRYFNPLVLYRDHGNKLSANLERIESHTLLVVSRALEQIQGDPYNIIENGSWNENRRSTVNKILTQ